MMLQVDKAYDHLVQYASATESNVRFVVSCCERLRGIYLREAHQTSKPSEHVVTVEPKHQETDTGSSQFAVTFTCGYFILLVLISLSSLVALEFLCSISGLMCYGYS